MELKIISKELIKPSSSTPNHLKTVKLSLIDQISPPVYIPLVFFYEANELKCLNDDDNDDTAQICQHLKRSLADTLTHFYPLAGKIDPDNFTIDCNDNGVDFTEARAHGVPLRDVIRDPRPEQLQIYVPVGPSGGIYDGNGTLFMAQVTFFDCGGIAVGACVVHLVADGPSLLEFTKAWAAICRGETLKFDPQFGAIARYFPARDLSDSDYSPSLLMGHDELMTKRLVFDKEKLAALKHEVAATTHDPTRVECVSAFIWKHFIESKAAAAEAKRRFVAVHVVNIRPRAGPSVEVEHAFGNGHFTTATELVDQGAPRLDELVRKLRRAIRRIDDEYIRRTHSEDRFLSEVEELLEVASGEEDVEGFLFSSWCRFPTYEVDFGWGRPVWVCTIALLLNSLAILMDTSSGDGIEAWINMLPQNVQSLEDQFELIGAANN